MKYWFTRKSSNRKVGPIPVTTSAAVTCPTSCPLMKNGCYAEGGPLRILWKKVEREGITWSDLLFLIKTLPPGQFWRHNQAGDLPGLDEYISRFMMDELVSANQGKRGFTYTHKPVLGDVGQAPKNRDLIRDANSRGFTINLSANNPGHADQLYDLGIGPVTTLIEDPSKNLHTPGGRRIVTCPAVTHDVTCLDCKLCAWSGRAVIIGFPVHGSSRRKAGTVVRTFSA